jgi:hypothetical protein
MNAVVTQKLRLMIQENGRSVVLDPRRCEQIMAGELADFASSARVLRMALRCGIPAALVKDVRPDAELAGLTLSLQQQGVSELKARDAMETWAAAIAPTQASTPASTHACTDPPNPVRSAYSPDPTRKGDAIPAATWQDSSPTPAAATVIPPTVIPPRTPPPAVAGSMLSHKAAAIAAAAALAFDLIVSVALMPTVPAPLLIGDIALLAASASLYRKNSRAIAWILFAVACFRGILVAVGLSAAGPLAALLGFALLLNIAMAGFCFKAAIANRSAAPVGSSENKLEGVQEVL